MRLVLLALIAACSWAQLRIDIRQKLCGRFQSEVTTEPRIATLPDDKGDVLVARWTAPGGQSAFSELIVWDTPEVTSCIVHLPRGSTMSPWTSRAIRRRTSGSALAGFRSAAGFPGSSTGGAENWFDLCETPTASYLCVSHNMGWPASAHFGTRLIPERFPPLESRVGQWSRKRLLDDLSHPGIPARDLILARELAKRELTEEELLALFDSRLHLENGALLQALVEADEAGRYAGAIRKYLLTYRAFGGKGHTPDPGPFQFLSRAKDANFDSDTLHRLGEARAAYDAFLKAAAHGTTPGDYRAMKERPCPADSLAPACGRALQEMRQRLALDEDGNPPAAK